MGWMKGFEPSTTGTTIRSSTTELHPPQNSILRSIFQSGTPGRTRTFNPWLRRPMLYPLSYRRIKNTNPYPCASRLSVHPCTRNHYSPRLFTKKNTRQSRGHVLVVGVERFELPTTCSQSRCATRLRYTPKRQLSKF